MTTTPYRLDIASENAFIIYFEQKIAHSVSQQVTAARQLLEKTLGSALIDLLPSYASLLVIFDPFQHSHATLQPLLTEALQQLTTSEKSHGRLIELPVYYSEESGPDLVQIARSKDISTDEVIRLHQATLYQVYAIGFAPGFAYLGEVDARLETPRLASPRARVPAGSVAIADRQTAVYPAASPGGWNLIGLCPVSMFNPAATPPMPVAVGDQVRFTAVGKVEFLQLGGKL